MVPIIDLVIKIIASLFYVSSDFIGHCFATNYAYLELSFHLIYACTDSEDIKDCQAIGPFGSWSAMAPMFSLHNMFSATDYVTVLFMSMAMRFANIFFFCTA